MSDYDEEETFPYKTIGTDEAKMLCLNVVRRQLHRLSPHRLNEVDRNSSLRSFGNLEHSFSDIHNDLCKPERRTAGILSVGLSIARWSKDIIAVLDDCERQQYDRDVSEHLRQLKSTVLSFANVITSNNSLAPDSVSFDKQRRQSRSNVIPSVQRSKRTIAVECPACKKVLVFASSSAGKDSQCPSCGILVTIPIASDGSN